MLLNQKSLKQRCLWVVVMEGTLTLGFQLEVFSLKFLEISAQLQKWKWKQPPDESLSYFTPLGQDFILQLLWCRCQERSIFSYTSLGAWPLVRSQESGRAALWLIHHKRVHEPSTCSSTVTGSGRNFDKSRLMVAEQFFCLCHEKRTLRALLGMPVGASKAMWLSI